MACNIKRRGDRAETGEADIDGSYDNTNRIGWNEDLGTEGRNVGKLGVTDCCCDKFRFKK
jgi:hypothetical protein